MLAAFFAGFTCAIILVGICYLLEKRVPKEPESKGRKRMTNPSLQSTMAATPIQDVVDTFFAFLEAKLPQYATLLKGANGVIDWILTKEGL